MNRVQKTPCKKLSAPRSEFKSPSKQVVKPVHKHTSSTPIPFRSPSPAKEKKTLAPTASVNKLGFSKIDLRKGIFSKKQSFSAVLQEKPVSGSSQGTPVPAVKQNKYHALSKEFKIDKRGMLHSKPDFRDSQGFYIPEAPPMIYEDLSKCKDN
jgi:hypothetical protein